MVDSAEYYNERVKEERERLRRLAKDFEPQIPAYSPKAVELTREQETQDYRTTKNTSGGFERRLEVEAAKFGLNKAVVDVLDWSIRNERA